MQDTHESHAVAWRGGMARRGLVVVIVVIGVLLALAIPWIQEMRETARREACQHRMVQLGLALDEYHVAMLTYPYGTINPSGPVRSAPEGFHHNWISGLLPRLNVPAVTEAVDSSVSVYAPANEPVRRERLAVLQCPSAASTVAAADEYAGSNYAGAHHSVETPIAADNNGVLILNRQITHDGIIDGLQYTLLVGEKFIPHDDLGWLSGTRATLRNTGHPIGLSHRSTQPGPPAEEAALYVGGFASGHPGGANFLIADGQVRFTSADTDPKVLEQLANRHDSEPARDEPARDEPAQDEPAQDEPAQDEPAQDEPAQDEPAQDEPAQDEPVE